MTRWAGWLIVLCGAGHTLGSLVETRSEWAGWFDGSVWGDSGYRDLGDATSAYWYTMFSFGPPLLLLGVLVLWLARRGITPPRFLAWTVGAWVVLTFISSGPSPLPVLLIACGLLIAESRRAARREPVRGARR